MHTMPLLLHAPSLPCFRHQLLLRSSDPAPRPSEPLLASGPPPTSRWQRDAGAPDDVVGSSAASNRSVACRAVTGGSRRDVEKLIARTQHRRPRHVKGVKPSKPDLMKELEEEEVAEQEVRRLAELAHADSTSSPYEEVSTNPFERKWAKGEGMGVPAVKEGILGGSEVFEGATDERGGKEASCSSEDEESVSSFKGQNDVVTPTENELPQDAKAWQQMPEERSQLERSGSAANTLSQVVEDKAAGTVKTAEETGEEVMKALSDTISMGQTPTGDEGRPMNEHFEEIASEVQEQVVSAPSAAREIADTIMDTASNLEKTIRETGEEVGQDVAEVGSAVQSILNDVSRMSRNQVKTAQAQAQKNSRDKIQGIGEGANRISREAQNSTVRVQDAVTRVAQESARTVEAVGREALEFGEVLLDVAKENFGTNSSSFDSESKIRSQQSRRNENGEENGQVLRGRLKGTTGVEAGEKGQEENSRYTGFKILVAGASGRTGRLIVKNLVRKGVSVRAFVRDVYRARSIKQLKNVEVVEGDLYKYETIKKALGDCNVVICAVGARTFLLDPLQTYQVEYEGVLNLISAAKNHGNVKKFILLSSIGVTHFQLIPLLFWKKQAELFLQRSGLDYTIVRPGGLRNASDEMERVMLYAADSQIFGGISRGKVAEVCVAALVATNTSEKIVEVLAESGEQKRSIEDLFSVV